MGRTSSASSHLTILTPATPHPKAHPKASGGKTVYSNSPWPNAVNSTIHNTATEYQRTQSTTTAPTHNYATTPSSTPFPPTSPKIHTHPAPTKSPSAKVSSQWPASIHKENATNTKSTSWKNKYKNSRRISNSKTSNSAMSNKLKLSSKKSKWNLCKPTELSTIMKGKWKNTKRLSCF